jgi:hypothetical protein
VEASFTEVPNCFYGNAKHLVEGLTFGPISTSVCYLWPSLHATYPKHFVALKLSGLHFLGLRSHLRLFFSLQLLLVEPHGQSPCLHAEVRFGTQAWHLI